MTNLEDLPEEEREIVALVRRFVDKDVKPTVQELEHANTYPEQYIETMKELGLFGITVPVERLPKPFLPQVMSVFMGPGGHAVCYYLRGGALLNFVGIIETELASEESDGHR